MPAICVVTLCACADAAECGVDDCEDDAAGLNPGITRGRCVI